MSISSETKRLRDEKERLIAKGKRSDRLIAELERTIKRNEQKIEELRRTVIERSRGIF